MLRVSFSSHASKPLTSTELLLIYISVSKVRLTPPFPILGSFFSISRFS